MVKQNTAVETATENSVSFGAKKKEILSPITILVKKKIMTPFPMHVQPQVTNKNNKRTLQIVNVSTLCIVFMYMLIHHTRYDNG